MRKWFLILLLHFTAVPGSAVLAAIFFASVPNALGRAPDTIVLSPSQQPERFLRGDWEVPDTVIVAYSSEFTNFARQLVAEAVKIPGMEVAILLGQDQYDEGYQWYGKYFADQQNVRLIVQELDSPWIRDYGPLQAYSADGQALWLDTPYAFDRPKDDQTPATLSSVWDIPLEDTPWALQGGAIIANGFGLCASTIEAFQQYEIDPRDQDAIDVLLPQIGCSVLALVPALADEETKHIDMFAQFISPDSIMIATVDKALDPKESERMNAATRGMIEAAAAFGIDLRVNRVPLPVGKKNRYYSYINGLRLANTFLVPSYTEVPTVQEQDAYNALIEAIPDVALVTVPADDMIELEGAVHCLSLGLNRK